MAGIRALDHIAIAVEDLDRDVALYRDRLGAEVGPVESLPERGVRLVKVRVGGVRLELFEPLEPDSPLARSIRKRGVGVHHLAFSVDDLDAVLLELKEQGVPLVDERPKEGSEGSRIAFLRPEALGGVLVEILEPGGGPDGRA